MTKSLIIVSILVIILANYLVSYASNIEINVVNIYELTYDIIEARPISKYSSRCKIYYRDYRNVLIETEAHCNSLSNLSSITCRYNNIEILDRRNNKVSYETKLISYRLNYLID